MYFDWMEIRHKIFIEGYKKSVNTYYHELDGREKTFR